MSDSQQYLAVTDQSEEPIVDREAFLANARDRATTNPVEISIRSLALLWNARRRTYKVVDRITRDLANSGLTTEPAFSEGWIDQPVRLVPRAAIQQPITEDPSSAADSTEVALRIGALEAASSGVVSISPNDTLEYAQSLMMRHDYSQLPVLSGQHVVKGALSWESIAQARLRSSQATLVNALFTPEVVSSAADLLEWIPRIVSQGFVLVARASDRVIDGIVTPADISAEFQSLAGPFLLLGEIERRMRRAIDRSFTVSDLQGVAGARPVTSADDLTIGEYVQLLQAPERWQRLGWPAERKVFTTALDEIRSIRNDIMHFSPDPLEARELAAMNAFLKWLRFLEP